MVRGGDKSLRRGAVREPVCRRRSESEERPSRVREVSEEEHGEDGGQHDNRQGDEDGGVDGPGDRLFRGTGLRVEDVHVPNHARVVVQGQGAIQDAGDRERQVPGVEGGSVHRAGEQDELREEPAEGRDARQAEEEDEHRKGQERHPSAQALVRLDVVRDSSGLGAGDDEERSRLHRAVYEDVEHAAHEPEGGDVRRVVGEPWYTSGAHMWNGTTATLNPKPAISNTSAMIRGGSIAGSAVRFSPVPRRTRSVVAPMDVLPAIP